MTSPRKPRPPTLIEAIEELLKEGEQLPAGVTLARVRAEVDDYYRERRLGERLITLGLVTPRLLLGALARQARARGDVRAACRYLSDALDDTHARLLAVVGGGR